jgi:L-tartrate/succinate antiporter
MATPVDTTRDKASNRAVATTVTTAPAAARVRIWEAIAPVAATVILALLPTPPGLPHFAWLYFSIFAGVIVGLVLEPLPGAAIAIIGLTIVAALAPFVLFRPEQLSAPGFRPPSAALNWALSGYSNPTVWLIFGAFILALGYERTGLGERIALVLVKRMGKNTLLLGYGVTLADTILAPFIPSPTARSGGIIYLIVSDLAPIYESKPNDISARKVRSYL